MGMLDDRLTRQGRCGRVWPQPDKPARKRFVAWFERGRDIRVKFFPTRRAAHLWLAQLEDKG
jgi:hypothetical protein